MIKWIVRQFTISELVQEILDDINRNPKNRKKCWIDYDYGYFSCGTMTMIIEGGNIHKYSYTNLGYRLTIIKTTFLERLLLKRALKNNGIMK